MIYREENDRCKHSKVNYLEGLMSLINRRQKQAENIRAEYFRDIFTNPEKYRKYLKHMLGWPLVEHKTKGTPKVSAEKLSQEDGYCIYRMQFDVLEGLKLTGLFFRVEGDNRKPLVIVQHGGLGTPEHIAGFYGDTTNYNNMLHRVLKQNVHVFAPQLLLWSGDYQVEYDRKAIDAQLKRVGSSIAAVEIYGITRLIDYFETQDYVSTFGMVGLSYGGFYTLYTTAIDTRIQSAISCSFFNKRDIVGWSDWTWLKSAEQFDDAEIACLAYPRKLCIEIGDEDELFDYRFAMESFERVQEICKDVGMQWIEFVVFNGTHEFCKDDGPITRLIRDII